MTNAPPPASGSRPPEDLFDQSVAGEEDPGASVDAPTPASRPGDEAPTGAPGTGEKLCSRCGGSGRLIGDKPCPDCKGTGRITAGIGGG